MASNEACRLNSENVGSQIPMDQVVIGDRLLLRPGDTCPVDGRVLEEKVKRMSPC